MKRKISLLLASALLLSLALTGCRKQNSTTLSAKGTDVYGKVTEISGDKISFDVVTIPEVPNATVKERLLKYRTEITDKGILPKSQMEITVRTLLREKTAKAATEKLLRMYRADRDYLPPEKTEPLR